MQQKKKCETKKSIISIDCVDDDVVECCCCCVRLVDDNLRIASKDDCDREWRGQCCCVEEVDICSCISFDAPLLAL